MQTIIYTDGASSGNPGPGGYGALVVRGNKITEIGGGDPRATNNKMELKAAVEALKRTGPGEKILIYTDSAYLVNGIKTWIKNWFKNNWKTSTGGNVLNKELWQELHALVEDREIDWRQIKGHAEIAGNNRADEIAVAYSTHHKPRLFDGSKGDYDVDLNDPTPLQMASTSKRERTNAKAYSYLSFVDDVLERHDTWAECERRVKGKQGAKFRKTISREDEHEIIKSWGL